MLIAGGEDVDGGRGVVPLPRRVAATTACRSTRPSSGSSRTCEPAATTSPTAPGTRADVATRSEASGDVAGVPDAFQRLWTPHRMVYIGGENKPADASAGGVPVLPGARRARTTRAWSSHRGDAVYVVMNLYPYNPGHLLVCPYRHVADYTDLTPTSAPRSAS